MMRIHPSVFLFLFVSGACLPGVAPAQGIQPKAPIENFRIPRFAENGFIQWVLRGERGLFQSEQLVRVEGMELRIYSADERKLVELSLDSPEADILIEENRAYSAGPIGISGGNFSLNGIGWNWQGDEKAVDVKSEARVVFAESTGASLMPLASLGGTAEEALTRISSKRLLLQTLSDGYRFEFNENVRVLSPGGALQSNDLVALVDLPGSGSESAVQRVGIESSNSIRRIIATGAVEFRQGEHRIRSERLESFPKEERAVLSGLTEVTLPGALLSGGQVESSPGRAILSGAASGSRAQMILYETGGLGVGGESQLSEETIILADQITMLEEADEYRFVFEGRVDLLSGALRQRSEKLTVNSLKTQREPAAGANAKIGRVYRLLAEGSVLIEQEGQSARADEVCYRPLLETAELTGEPEFSDGESILLGQRIELEPGRVTVDGSKTEPVVVELPEIADLAREASGEEESVEAGEDSAEAGGEIDSAEAVEPVPTIVRSRQVVIYHGGESQRIDFNKDVEVTGTNLRLLSKKMEVYLSREEGSGPAARSGFIGGDVKRIIAREDVEIVQGERTATCRTAELLPADGIIVLTGNAHVLDKEGSAKGHRITLNRGQGRALVEADPGEGDGRARVTLPGLGRENTDSGL